MAGKIRYVVQDELGAVCPDCGGKMRLLAPGAAAGARLPVFYLCRDGGIFQAGVGRVKKEA